jgi:hypothetical protein
MPRTALGSTTCSQLSNSALGCLRRWRRCLPSRPRSRECLVLGVQDARLAPRGMWSRLVFGYLGW